MYNSTEMLRPLSLIVESPSKREKMLQTATGMAEILLTRKEFVQIGIGGSLARGIKEKPNDIDIWIFCGNKISDTKWLNRRYSSLDEKILAHLSSSNSYEDYIFMEKIIRRIDNSEFLWDFHFIGNKLTANQIEILIKSNMDPTFFQRESELVLIYDKNSGKFIRKNPYSLETSKKIDTITFKELKQKIKLLNQSSLHQEELEDFVLERQFWKSVFYSNKI